MEIINKYSAASKKIQIFMSFFRGRNDVYAKRWENKKGVSGYSPVCANEWKPGVCFKPNVKCFKCRNKSYSQLNEAVIGAHLTGSKIIGIYPMNPDETCYFLAMDFDKEGWQKDISAVRDICNTYQIPIAVERSRSGNGGHIWFFFEDRFSASAARKFGMSLLTKAMEKRHELPFSSYDRLFPNQDTMPEGGLGNLIALPLEKSARNKDNAVFINDRFEPHEDQWAFLSGIQKLSEQQLQSLTEKLGRGSELGLLKTEIPDNRNFVLVATGSFIGEGFDESRLDTLFLAMPISWKGTLQQYAGRLHRLHNGKKDVQIYDYVDIHVKMHETMYGKRLKGYASIGYMAKADNIADSPTEIIFDKQNFFSVYLNDIDTANEHILIVSPFITKKRVLQVMDHLKEKIDNQVKVSIMTRPAEEFQEEKKRFSMTYSFFYKMRVSMYF